MNIIDLSDEFAETLRSGSTINDIVEALRSLGLSDDDVRRVIRCTLLKVAMDFKYCDLIATN